VADDADVGELTRVPVAVVPDTAFASRCHFGLTLDGDPK
jgi:hypothetical protein